jgi:hypothetical protein
MKLVKLLAAAALLVSGLAQAEDGWYSGVSMDHKVKQNSATNEYHNVYGLTVGKKLGSGFSVEGLLENEQVEQSSSGSAHEGLMQVRVNKSFDTGTMFTPYIGVAAGEKNKATIAFPYYRYDLGVSTKLTDVASVKLNWRHREAFNDTTNGTATKYATDESSFALVYKLTPVDTVAVSYKQERATDGKSSEYNTTGVSYSRSF